MSEDTARVSELGLQRMAAGVIAREPASRLFVHPGPQPCFECCGRGWVAEPWFNHWCRLTCRRCRGKKVER